MARKPGTASVCFLLAMYRNAESVRAFVTHLRSLPRPAGIRLDVVVADNGAEPAPPDLPGATVFDPGCNLGYVPGCAWALRQWRGEGNLQPDWICISNTDLRLGDDFFLQLASASFDAGVGVVAPDVRLANGAAQNPILHRRPPRSMMFAYAVLSRLALFMPVFELSVRMRHIVRGISGRRGETVAPAPIYAAHGSIFLVHRQFFDRGGALAYRGTMYGEEIHIAEQTRRAGLRVVLMPSLRVLHQEHATTRDVPWLQRQRWHAESAGVLWSDYFQRAPEA